MCAHRRDQRGGARHDADARRRLVEQRRRHAGEQGDAGGERRGEIDLAVHRLPRQLGDLVAQAEELGELVEHLVLDDGRFHVGDEQRLAPPGARLNDDVGGEAGKIGRQTMARPGIGLVGIETLIVEIAGAAGGEPVDLADTGAQRDQRLAQRGDGIAERSGAGVGNDGGGDEGEDGVRHAGVIGEPPAKGKLC